MSKAEPVREKTSAPLAGSLNLDHLGWSQPEVVSKPGAVFVVSKVKLPRAVRIAISRGLKEGKAAANS